MTEPGRPAVVSAGQRLLGPAGGVTYPMIVTAERDEVVDAVRTAVCVWDAMIEVTIRSARLESSTVALIGR